MLAFCIRPSRNFYCFISPGMPPAGIRFARKLVYTARMADIKISKCRCQGVFGLFPRTCQNSSIEISVRPRCRRATTLPHRPLLRPGEGPLGGAAKDALQQGVRQVSSDEPVERKEPDSLDSGGLPVNWTQKLASRDLASGGMDDIIAVDEGMRQAKDY